MLLNKKKFKGKIHLKVKDKRKENTVEGKKHAKGNTFEEKYFWRKGHQGH